MQSKLYKDSLVVRGMVIMLFGDFIYDPNFKGVKDFLDSVGIFVEFYCTIYLSICPSIYSLLASRR